MANPERSPAEPGATDGPDQPRLAIAPRRTQKICVIMPAHNAESVRYGFGVLRVLAECKIHVKGIRRSRHLS